MSRYHWRKQHVLFVIIMSFVAIVWGSNNCLAQPANLSAGEELRYRQQQEAEESKRKEQQKDVFLQTKTKQDTEISLPPEKDVFLIRMVRLEGTMIEKFPWAQEMLIPYANRSIGKEGIQIIVKRLLEGFIVRGYVTTRISVPNQDISDGVLRLMVITGTIGKIRIDGLKSDNWRTAFPMDVGDILNIRDLEQGLEQMRRLPSQDANMQIIAGEKPGESDITITVKHGKDVRSEVSINDSGQSETGKLQSAITMSLDNLLHSNDMLDIRISNDLSDKGAEKGTSGSSIDYSFPYGNWTFGVNKNVYDYHQQIQGDTQTIQYSGKIDSMEFRAQRLLHRDGQSKTNTQLRVFKQHRSNNLNDIQIDVQNKETTAAELSLSHRQYYGQTVLDTKISCRLGTNTQPDVVNIPTTHYKLWTFETQLG